MTTIKQAMEEYNTTHYGENSHDRAFKTVLNLVNDELVSYINNHVFQGNNIYNYITREYLDECKDKLMLNINLTHSALRYSIISTVLSTIEENYDISFNLSFKTKIIENINLAHIKDEFNLKEFFKNHKYSVSEITPHSIVFIDWTWFDM